MPRSSRTSVGGSTIRRLVILINELGGGGAERVAATLANYLHEQMGLEITIVTLDGGPSSYPLVPGVEVRPLWTHRLARGPGKVLSLPLAAVAFARLVRVDRPDAAMSFLVRANIVMVLSGWLGNWLPTIISERVASTVYAGSSLVAIVMRTLVRLLYPRADGVIAISEGVKKSLVAQGIPVGRIRVIHNPQSVDQIMSEAATADTRRDNTFRLISVARLTDQKDLPTLLRAFRMIRQVEGRARLIMLGEGPDAEALKRLAVELDIADAIEWRGWLPPYRAMAEADVFVLSSRYEGFANVIVEAMACGLPVVSTDCESGPSEILANGEYGLLVPVGDSKAMAAAILRLIGDPQLRGSLRDRGRRRARDFDVSVMAPAYLEVLRHGKTGGDCD